MRIDALRSAARIALFASTSNVPLGCKSLLTTSFVPLAPLRRAQREKLGFPLSKIDDSRACDVFCRASRSKCTTEGSSSQSENAHSYDNESKSLPLKEKEDLLLSDDVASIDNLVLRRADARRCGNYELADTIRDEIDSLVESSFPLEYRIELKDIPRKLGGGSTWEVVPKLKEPIERHPSDSDGGTSVLQLSHDAIGLATSAAEKNVPVNQKELHDIVSEAVNRLELTGATELRGRKAADAAFWFALAGVSGAKSSIAASLFDSLTLIAIEELQRFGLRSSCRSKDIMHMVERLAASGINGELSRRLYQVAADCLEAKDFKGCNTSTSTPIVEMLRNGEFDMHSDRSLLWIWRFSIRQRKQRSFLRVAANQYERTAQVRDSDKSSTSSENKNEAHQVEYPKWENMFNDPSLPLVVDVGSGMGVSLHGLATLEGQGSTSVNTEWNKCNYVGVDLSRVAVGYANGIATRWGINGRLQFCVGSADDFLQHIRRTYPGEVSLIMIQFPTPFRLQVDSVTDINACGYDDKNERLAKKNGNMQLPKHPFSGFMVTKDLLDCAHDILQGYGGKMLTQSNCEDVAVMMRKCANLAGFESVQVPNFVASFDDIKARVPQRTAEYVRLGGERALGEGWSAESFLPRRGATETEISCFLERTPVHRCMFVASESSHETS